MLAAEQKRFWECFCASYARSDGFVLKNEKSNARHMSVECRSLITALNSPNGRVFNDASTFKTLQKLSSFIENHFQLITIPFHIIKAIFTNLCHTCHKCSTPVPHLWQGVTNWWWPLDNRGMLDFRLGLTLFDWKTNLRAFWDKSNRFVTVLSVVYYCTSAMGMLAAGQERCFESCLCVVPPKC